MGKVVARIVLTGGPCAGKTSALSKIEQVYSERGYKVLIINESATELINGGVKCFGNNCLSVMDFQRIILKYQLIKENIYEEVVTKEPNDIPCIIVYDRGALDNKAYINQDSFNLLLTELGKKELDLMDHYDMIIHMVTAADGASSFYTLANNTSRTETIDDAKKLDKKTINAWSGHSNVKIVGNEKDFESKLQEVINDIDNYLGNPVTIRKQRKYLVDVNNSQLPFNSDNSTLIHISQSYINDSHYEIRLRQRTLDGETTYYLTKQEKKSNGLSCVHIDKRITKEEYIDILNDNSHFSIEKDRYSFNMDKQYYRLDLYENGLCILEVDPTIDNILLPSYLSIIKEVTDDSTYSNYNIAKKKQKVFSIY